jgi:hypothetical protein
MPWNHLFQNLRRRWKTCLLDAGSRSQIELLELKKIEIRMSKSETNPNFQNLNSSDCFVLNI